MKHSVIIAVLILVAAPLAVAQDDGGPADESKWGRCQAFFAAETGNDASNGTVYDAPPFQNLNTSTCNDEDPPWNGTEGEDHVPIDDHPGKNAQDPGSQGPDDPGAPDDPGSQAPDDPGAPSTPSPPDNPGAPDDPGSQAPDNPASQYIPDDPTSYAPDNPGDDHQPDNPGPAVQTPAFGSLP